MPGICFQTVELMHRALTALGYQADFALSYSLNGLSVEEHQRQKEKEEDNSSHVILIVTIKDKKYLLDPGMAAKSCPSPVVINPEEDTPAHPVHHPNYKLVYANDYYVICKEMNGTWTTINYSRLSPISLEEAQQKLRHLEFGRQPTRIRDEITVAGKVTPEGTDSIYCINESWLHIQEKNDPNSNKPQVTKATLAIDDVPKNWMKFLGLKLPPQN